GRCKHCADQDHRIREAATDRSEELADRIEQILGHSGTLENQSHQREERDREQCVVLHDAEDAQRQCLQQGLRHQAQLDADHAEEQAAGAERERDRVAEEQEDDQADEHDRRHVRADEFHHRVFPWAACSRAAASLLSSMNSASCSSSLLPSGLCVGSGMRPRRNATRLMSSEIAWMPRRAKPSGSSANTGQRISPPAFDEYSFITYDRIASGIDRWMTTYTRGSTKPARPMMSIQICVRFEKRPEITSIFTCPCRSIV